MDIVEELRRETVSERRTKQYDDAFKKIKRLKKKHLKLLKDLSIKEQINYMIFVRSLLRDFVEYREYQMKKIVYDIRKTRKDIQQISDAIENKNINKFIKIWF